MNQQQLQLINYLREENRVLREQLAKSDYGSTMTSAPDWPPRQRDWEASFSESGYDSHARDPAGLASPAGRGGI